MSLYSHAPSLASVTRRKGTVSETNHTIIQCGIPMWYRQGNGMDEGHIVGKKNPD